MQQQICKNCGNNFGGKFCNSCGEKVYTAHDKTMHHFFHEALHFFTHFDSKFFKTLLVIFRRPGLLSVTYCGGARNKYYKPVSLFFIGIILYLLFPAFPGLNMKFEGVIQNADAQHMSFLAELASRKATSQNISLHQLAENYDHHSPATAKILLLIILPLTGIALKALFAKKSTYFFDYLILGTEASCIMLYLTFFIMPLLLIGPALLLKHFNIHWLGTLDDTITIPLYATYLIFWSTTAFKRFFHVSFKKAFLKGLLFFLLQAVIIYIIYRTILFLTVLLLI